MAIVLALAWPPAAYGQSLTLSGDATWSLAAVWGSAQAMEGTGIGAGDPGFSPRLRLNLSGEVADGMTLSAEWDSQAANLQRLSLTVQRGVWTVRAGDIQLEPVIPSIAQPHSLKGVEVEGSLGLTPVALHFGLAQGLPAVKEFTGRGGIETIRYVPRGPDTPTRVGTHLEASLEGAAYFPLGSFPFDPDLVDVLLIWKDGPDETLAGTLAAHGLGELIVTPAGRTAVLSPGATFRVDRRVLLPPPPGQDVIILAQDPAQVVREQLEALIRHYNTVNQLEGQERLVYPYGPGTASDRFFLHQLIENHVEMGVGAGGSSEVRIGLGHARRRRYYDLGRQEIEAGSVQVALLRAGQQLAPWAVPGLERLAVYEETGILDLGPAAGAMLDELDAIEVTYRYRTGSHVHPLGPSVVAGSERVFLNDRPLARHVEYTIDYEAGLLILLVPVGTEDRIRVEYETFRSGLGDASPYPRAVLAGRAAVPVLPGWTVELELARGADVPPPADQAATLGIMPNTHLVAGLRSHWSTPRWEIDLHLARSHDQFPFDQNTKPHQPNQVTVLAGGSGSGPPFLVAVHQNGLSVWLPPDLGANPGDPGTWRHYGPGQGVMGLPVLDLAVTPDLWFLATGSGLIAIRLGETDLPTALDSPGRWRRFSSRDGLPPGPIRAVAVDEHQTLWVATGQGLLSSPLRDLEEPRVAWTRHLPPVGPEITALAPGPAGALYMTGERGLARLTNGSFEVLASGLHLEHLALAPASLAGPFYAAGPGGLYRWSESGGLEPVPGVPRVRDLQYHRGRLWIATDQGLWVVEEPYRGQARLAALPGVPLASLGIGPLPQASEQDALWIGAGRAKGAPTALWVLPSPEAEPQPVVPFAHGLIPPEDVYRYTDLPAGQATAQGWRGSLALTRRFDRGRLYLTALRQQAGYLPLGGTTRREAWLWQAGADWTLTPAISLAFRHQEEEGGRSGTASRAMRSSALIRQGFLGNQLTLGVELEQVAAGEEGNPGQVFRGRYLMGTVEGNLEPGLSLQVRYRRPLVAQGSAPDPGDALERMSYDLGWEGEAGRARVRLAYQGEQARGEHPGAHRYRTHQALGRVLLVPVRAAGLTLSPTLFASRRERSGWSSDQTRAELGGHLEGSWEALGFESTMTLAQAHHPATGKREAERRTQFLLRWTGWDQVEPSLEWRRAARQVSIPTLGRQLSSEDQVRASLHWRPRPGLASTVTVANTRRAERAGMTSRASLVHQVTHTLSPGTTARSLIEASWETAPAGAITAGPLPPLEQGLRVELGLHHQWTPAWSAEGAVGGVWLQRAGEPFSSAYTRLALRLGF